MTLDERRKLCESDAVGEDQGYWWFLIIVAWMAIVIGLAHGH